MAASIIRLQQENQELHAEVALLREEQRILAKGFPSPAKAAVIEGGTGYSGVERPEPSPHFYERRFREVHEANARIAGELVKAREEAKRATYDAAQETIKVSTVKSHWIEACRERDKAIRALTNITALPTMAVDHNVVRARKIAQEALKHLEAAK